MTISASLDLEVWIDRRVKKRSVIIYLLPKNSKLHISHHDQYIMVRERSV